MTHLNYLHAATLYCPSRREARTYPLERRHCDAYGPLGARTDYAVSGVSSSEDGSLRGNGAGENITIANDGVWSLGWRMSTKKITDGLSKTYLVGEKSMDSLHHTTGEDVGDRAPITGLTDNFGAANSYVRFAAKTPVKDVADNCQSCHDFGSAHDSSWNMAMADGSAHSMNYQMDVFLHRALAFINGEEAASASGAK